MLRSSLPLTPKTTILSGPKKVSSDQRPIIKFGADRANCAFEIQLDGSHWIKASSPLRFKQPLADGNHTFKVRAKDSAGTEDPNPAQLHWTVDTTKPEALILVHPQGLTHEADSRFEIQASEEHCKFPFHLEYRKQEKQEWLSSDVGSTKNGGGLGHTNGVVAEVLDSRKIRVTVKGMIEGQHRLVISVTDEAGNEGDEQEYVWAVDTTPPKTAIRQAPKRFTKSKVAVFVISAAGVEEGWTYQYKLNDDNGWTTGHMAVTTEESGNTAKLTLKDLMEGPQRLDVRAVDRAGNIDREGVSYQWTIHDKPADTFILEGPKELSNEQTAAFSVGSSETQFSFAYRLDGGSVQRPHGLKLVSSPATFNVSGIGEGNHTILVRATDVTGGEDPTPATYRWYVDLTPPQVRLLNQPPKVSLDTNAIFGVDANEAYSLMYKLDSGSWQTSDGSILRDTQQGGAEYERTMLHGPVRFKMSGLKEGKHQLFLKATDSSGNTNSVDPVVWIVDFGPPSTTLEKTPPQQTKSKKSVFVVSASEADCVIQYRIDRKSWTNPGKEPKVVKAHPVEGGGETSAVSLEVWVGPGFHVIEFRAKDAAGNADTDVKAFEWVTF